MGKILILANNAGGLFRFRGMLMKTLMEQGNDVWLCSNAMILGNVTVCDGCRIGAGAIVLDDLSESGTYIGQPAHLIRVRKEEK